MNTNTKTPPPIKVLFSRKQNHENEESLQELINANYDIEVSDKYFIFTGDEIAVSNMRSLFAGGVTG